MQALAALQGFSFIFAPLLSQLDLHLHPSSIMTTSWPSTWMDVNSLDHSSPSQTTQHDSIASTTDPALSSSSTTSSSPSHSSSSASAVSHATAVVKLSASSLLGPCGVLYLSSPDLVAHTSRFLSITDLLQCSSLTRWLHAVVDSDRVWRRRLMRALHIQSSYIPLEIQPPYREEDEDEDSAHAAALPGEQHERKELERLQPVDSAQPASTTAGLLSSPSLSSASLPAPPSLAEAAAVCLEYYTRRVNKDNFLRCDITAVAILHAPADSFPAPRSSQQSDTAHSGQSYYSEDEVEGDDDDGEEEEEKVGEEEEVKEASPMASASPQSSPAAPAVAASSAACLVYHVKLLLSRSVTVNKTDCRAFALRLLPTGAGWQVERMGLSYSGRLVLNEFSSRNLLEPQAEQSVSSAVAASASQFVQAALPLAADLLCARLAALPHAGGAVAVAAAASSHPCLVLAPLGCAGVSSKQPFPPIPSLPFPALPPAAAVCGVPRVGGARCAAVGQAAAGRAGVQLAGGLRAAGE